MQSEGNILGIVTMELFERTNVPDSAMPWLPTFACALAGGLTAILACPEPSARLLTPGVAALRAVLCVCLVAGVTAVVARVSFAAFFPSVGEQAGAAALAYAGNGVWFAPLAVFVGQDRSWSILGAALLGLATARLLRRCRGGFDEVAPEESLSFDGQMFVGLAPAGSTRRLFPTFTATVAMEAGVIAQAVGQTGVAAVLAGIGCFIVAGSAAPVVQAQPGFSSRQLRKELAIQGLCAVALATLGLIRIPGLSETHAWSSRTGAAPSPPGNFADKDLLSGVILLTDLPRHVKLVAPIPNQRATVSLNRAASATVIEFSGEYWIFPIPMQRPPKNSMVVRGTPLTYVFTSVDRSALIMQARQRLGFSISPRCCSAIEVAVRNADKQPETIALRVSLATSTLSRGRYQQLGVNPTSAPPLTGGIGFRVVSIQAAMQLLRFQS
jgi:hypothetical protein